MFFGLFSVEPFGKCAPQQKDAASIRPRTMRLEKPRAKTGEEAFSTPIRASHQKLAQGDFNAYAPPCPRICACRPRHSAFWDRNGPRGNHTENIAPVSRRHHRQGRFPRPEVPYVRRE